MTQAYLQLPLWSRENEDPLVSLVHLVVVDLLVLLDVTDFQVHKYGLIIVLCKNASVSAHEEQCCCKNSKTGSSIKRTFVSSCPQANQVNLEIQAWRVLPVLVDHLAERETSDLPVSLVSEAECQI